MKYQLKVWLPWLFRRYILWQRDAELQPLYNVDNQDYNVTEQLDPPESKAEAI